MTEKAARETLKVSKLKKKTYDLNSILLRYTQLYNSLRSGGWTMFHNYNFGSQLKWMAQQDVSNNYDLKKKKKKKHAKDTQNGQSGKKQWRKIDEERAMFGSSEFLIQTHVHAITYTLFNN